MRGNKILFTRAIANTRLRRTSWWFPRNVRPGLRHDKRKLRRASSYRSRPANQVGERRVRETVPYPAVTSHVPSRSAAPMNPTNSLRTFEDAVAIVTGGASGIGPRNPILVQSAHEAPERSYPTVSVLAGLTGGGFGTAAHRLRTGRAAEPGAVLLEMPRAGQAKRRGAIRPPSGGCRHRRFRQNGHPAGANRRQRVDPPGRADRRGG